MMRCDTDVMLLSTEVLTENLLLFWILEPILTSYQDTLVDKISFSHTTVTVSPSRMVFGSANNLVSSRKTKEKGVRTPHQLNVIGATHQTPQPQDLSRGFPSIRGAVKDKAVLPRPIPRPLVPEAQRLSLSGTR